MNVGDRRWVRGGREREVAWCTSVSRDKGGDHLTRIREYQRVVNDSTKEDRVE